MTFASRLRRLAGAVMAFACLASGVAAQVRPLTVEDIVTTEAFGRASISPDERWAVYEKRGAYESAPRFDFGHRSQYGAMDLWIVDLGSPSEETRRLLPGEGPGLLRGAWSPAGTGLTVQRLRDGRLELGIVALPDRTVRWTGLTPEMPAMGSAVEWIDENRVLLVVRPDGSLPNPLRYYSGGQAGVAEAWRATAGGREPSRTVIDTGGGVARAEAPTPQQALVLFDRRTAEVRTLAQGRVVDFTVSPDGRQVALLQGGEPVAARTGVLIAGDLPTRQRLTLLPVGGGPATVVEGLDVAPHLLRWAPDSSAILAWARADGDDWGEGDLVRIGRDGSTAVFDRSALEPMARGMTVDVLRGVRADWLGDRALLYARRPDEDRFDWHVLSLTGPAAPLTDLSVAPSRLLSVDEGGARLLADGAVWRADASRLIRDAEVAERVREIVPADIEKPFRLRFNDAPRQAWAGVLGPPGETWVVGPNGLVRRLGLNSEGDDPRVLAISSDAALTVSRVGLAETLSLRTLGGERAIDRVNTGKAGVVLSRVEPLEHADALGRPTRSSLLLPPDRAPGAVRGLLVVVYPGSVESGLWFGAFNLTYGLRSQVLAGAGYAVLSPSVPIDDPRTTDPDFYRQSVDLAVDAALAAHPDLPRDRIAVLGHSFGGYAALAIAARSSRYRSYVAWAGMSDRLGLWGEFVPATRSMPQDEMMMAAQQAWVEAGQGGPAGPPWSDLATHAERSPFLDADAIRSPVLLITADRDFIPMSQSERMFSALNRLGGRSRLVTYWGEDHMLWSPANIRDLYAQVFDWLDETLAVEITRAAPADPPTSEPNPPSPPP